MIVDRALLPLVSLLATVGLLAGCGTGASGSADVEISGGLVTHALAGEATCEPAPGSRPGMLAGFYLDLGGLHYQLRFLTDHDGPGAYAVSDEATFVALNGQGPGWSTLTDSAGWLVADADGRSGTIDAWLTPEPSSGMQAVHVAGTWRCPPRR